MTSDSKAPVTDEQRAREQFEAWWWKRHPDYTSELLKRTSKSGAYDSDWVNGMWLAWSAATENLTALLASRALEATQPYQDPHSPSSQSVVERWLLAYQVGEAKEGDCKGIMGNIKREARKEALEEAAQVLQRKADEWPIHEIIPYADQSRYGHWDAFSLDKFAAEIRSLAAASRAAGGGQ